MRCAVDACLQGRQPCVAPHICGELPIGSAERYELRLDAEAAARRLAATGQAQRNPHPAGTRRNVVWTTYFLERSMLTDRPAGSAA